MRVELYLTDPKKRLLYAHGQTANTYAGVKAILNSTIRRTQAQDLSDAPGKIVHTQVRQHWP